MKGYALRQGDCLEVMKGIPDGFVDLVLTDPPYNIARANNFSTMGRAGIDFGEWDKNADILTYITEVCRVLRKGGSFIVFNDWKNLGLIAAYAEQQNLVTKDLLRIEKRNPMPRNRDRRYITDYECAIWFVQPGAKWIFHRQDPAYQRPKFVASIDKGLHPTQKPLRVMQELLAIHSDEQSVLLDPFMGSGTTGVACANLGRKFIGIELDKEYFSAAEKRVAKAYADNAEDIS